MFLFLFAASVKKKQPPLMTRVRVFPEVPSLGSNLFSQQIHSNYLVFKLCRSFCVVWIEKVFAVLFELCGVTVDCCTAGVLPNRYLWQEALFLRDLFPA